MLISSTPIKPKVKVRTQAKSEIVKLGATASKPDRRERLLFATNREAQARAAQLREEHFDYAVAAHSKSGTGSG